MESQIWVLIKGTVSLKVKSSERNRKLENLASLESQVCEVLLYCVTAAKEWDIYQTSSVATQVLQYSNALVQTVSQSQSTFPALPCLQSFRLRHPYNLDDSTVYVYCITVSYKSHAQHTRFDFWAVSWKCGSGSIAENSSF